MRSFLFAWRSLTRQPARALLGIAGIAVVGALLFDMLLLSRGLAISFRDLLDQVGFDVRVTAGQFVPSRGPRIRDARQVGTSLRALPEVEQVTALRFGRAQVVLRGGGEIDSHFMGVDGIARGTWTLVEGRGLPERSDAAPPVVLVNPALATHLEIAVGDVLMLRGSCDPRWSAAPPIEFEVGGIAAIRFDAEGQFALVARLADLIRICRPADPDAVTLFLVAARPDRGPEAAVSAIGRALPDLHAYTNRAFVDRLQVTDFSYFRQVSFALSCVTLFFAFLLITTLLTVSVNQRLGEVAALRALGFRRRRIAADLLWESLLLVGTGGLLALPIGGALAVWLDAILRQMPGIPMNLHFFMFHTRAAVTYVVVLITTGGLAAIYPVYLAARLPITATLRREVVS